MRRHFVIEAKSVAVMADTDDTSAETNEPSRTVLAGRLVPARHQSGRQRIPGKRVEHVGDQQFLMLLLMMKPKFHETQRFLWRARQKPEHRVVDMGPVLRDARRLRPRQQATHRPRMT